MVYCSQCGSEMQGDASYCPKCGRAANAGSGVQQDQWGYPYWDKHAYRAEKRALKHARHAARWNMRWSPEWGLLNAMTGGLFVLILGGLLFLAASGQYGVVTRSNFWEYLLVAIGAILVLRGTASIVISRGTYWFGGIIGGLFLITIGMAGLSESTFARGLFLWPAVIALCGLLIIVAGVGSYVFRLWQPHN